MLTCCIGATNAYFNSRCVDFSISFRKFIHPPLYSNDNCTLMCSETPIVGCSLVVEHAVSMTTVHRGTVKRSSSNATRIPRQRFNDNCHKCSSETGFLSLSPPAQLVVPCLFQSCESGIQTFCLKGALPLLRRMLRLS